MKIIAISGKRGSQNRVMAEQISLACERDPDMAAAVFSFQGLCRIELMHAGFPHNVLNGMGDVEKVRNLTMSFFAARRFVEPDYWLRGMWKHLGKARRVGISHAIISDLRFWNEAEQLRASGAILVRMELTPAPLYRTQHVPGVDDDQSETDLDQWSDWDHEFQFRMGDIEGIRAAAETVLEATIGKEAEA